MSDASKARRKRRTKAEMAAARAAEAPAVAARAPAFNHTPPPAPPYPSAPLSATNPMAAILASMKPLPVAAPRKIEPDYSDDTDRRNDQRRQQASAARDIGDIPPVKNPALRAEVEGSFRRYCEVVHPEAISLGWSDKHLELIAVMELIVATGGLTAFAMPRGSGKSTLAQFYAEWLLATGRKRFLVLIGATDEAAESTLDAIKNSFRFCDPLLDLFPEVAYPVRALEGLGKRTAGQTCNGVATSMAWAAGEFVLPTVKGSASSGAVIKSRGITGSIRGLTHQTPEGIRLRPDLVLADDPQTSESAASPTQTAKRLSILNGDVMGLAGPGESMTLLVPCTVIQRGDLADQLLDREKNPEWQSVRARLVESWPENGALWDEYLELRASEMRRGQVSHPEATAFYLAHREDMDKGAKVMWETRKLKHEVSAIQHAYHLKHRDAASFAAEMQNEPLVSSTSFGRLDARKLAVRFDATPRRVAPESTTQITIGMDVQKTCLYFCMVAWNEDNGGTVIDYGVFPSQVGMNLGLKGVEMTLQHKYKASVSASIAQGIHDLSDYLLGSEINIEGGAGIMRPALALVDSGWGPEHDTVLNAVRSHQYANALLAYKGLPVRATARPMAEWTKQPGTRVGLDWHVKKPSGRNSIRVAHADANAWRTRVAERLTNSEHEPSAIKFFATGGKWGGVPDHTNLTMQLCSEAPVEHDVNGMRRVEWGVLPNQDNHLWDCLVMAAVGANIMGIGPRSADPKEKDAFAGKRLSHVPEKAFSNRESGARPSPATPAASAPRPSAPALPTRRRVSTLPTASGNRR